VPTTSTGRTDYRPVDGGRKVDARRPPTSIDEDTGPLTPEESKKDQPPFTNKNKEGQPDWIDLKREEKSTSMEVEEPMAPGGNSLQI